MSSTLIKSCSNFEQALNQSWNIRVHKWNIILTCCDSNIRRLPNGWPAFSNCNVFQTVGITLAVIAIFISAYAVLCVGVCKMFRVCKRKPHEEPDVNNDMHDLILVEHWPGRTLRNGWYSTTPHYYFIATKGFQFSPFSFYLMIEWL